MSLNNVGLKLVFSKTAWLLSIFIQPLIYIHGQFNDDS